MAPDGLVSRSQTTFFFYISNRKKRPNIKEKKVVWLLMVIVNCGSENYVPYLLVNYNSHTSDSCRVAQG